MIRIALLIAALALACLAALAFGDQRISPDQIRIALVRPGEGPAHVCLPSESYLIAMAQLLGRAPLKR